MIPRTSPNVSMTNPIMHLVSGDELYVLEHVHRQVDAGRRQALGTLRPDSGRAESPVDLAVDSDTHPLEEKDVLHRDHFAFHASELGDGGDLSRAVSHSRHL